MKNRFKKVSTGIFCILIGIAVAGISMAEEIAFNPSCMACPVQIKFEPAEAKNLLGKKGLDLFAKLKNFKGRKIKIDMDQKLPTGTEASDDQGYEIAIWSNYNELFIQSMADESIIMVTSVFKKGTDANDFKNWEPYIMLRPGNYTEILRSDRLPQAWDKIKAGHLYSWLYKNEKKSAAPGPVIATHIKQALGLLIDNNNKH